MAEAANRIDSQSNFKRPAKIGKWRPKKWKPVYEEIICLNIVAGFSRDDLAKRFNMTPQHISNILNTEQADILRRVASERIRGGALERADNRMLEISERVEKLKMMALERVETLLNDDEVFEKAPFKMVEKSLKILSAKGGLLEKVSDSGSDSERSVNNITNINVLNQQNNVAMTAETMQKFQKGLDKALEVKELHGTVLPESFDGK